MKDKIKLMKSQSIHNFSNSNILIDTAICPAYAHMHAYAPGQGAMGTN